MRRGMRIFTTKANAVKILKAKSIAFVNFYDKTQCVGKGLRVVVGGGGEEWDQLKLWGVEPIKEGADNKVRNCSLQDVL